MQWTTSNVILENDFFKHIQPKYKWIFILRWPKLAEVVKFRSILLCYAYTVGIVMSQATSYNWTQIYKSIWAANP